jgi:hypothetical protein
LTDQSLQELSRDGHQRRASAVEHARSDATSLNTVLHAPIAVWTKSNALFLKVVGKSEQSRTKCAKSVLPSFANQSACRKWSRDDEGPTQAQATIPKTSQNGNASAGVKVAGRKLASRGSVSYQQPTSIGRGSHDAEVPLEEHVPHSICEYCPHFVSTYLFDLKSAAWAARLTDWEDQTTGHRLNLSMQSLNRRLSFTNNVQASSPFPVLQNSPLSPDSQYFSPTALKFRAVATLPYFIKPLPPRIGPEEVAYLEMKGVLTLPSITLRNELLRAYIEFVHPYMPLLDLYEFLLIIESGNGALGRVSLILYQAVMFAGSAFVEMQYLHSAGYSSRKQARKDFFQKTRVS